MKQGLLFNLPEPTDPIQADSNLITYIPRKALEPIPKQPRPEHKPYEPNTASLFGNFKKIGQHYPRYSHYFHIMGVWLTELHLRSGCIAFLEQRSTDPKLQKARIWKWEGKDIKVPAYHWREYENGSAHYLYKGLYKQHFLGWTDNVLQEFEWERDFITAAIEEKLEKC